MPKHWHYGYNHPRDGRHWVIYGTSQTANRVWGTNDEIKKIAIIYIQDEGVRKIQQHNSRSR